MNSVVQGLWVGGPLSPMEQLSICSFLENGHDYHLFCYEPVVGVPPGTTLRDGREILPESMIFGYAGDFAAGSYAAFSNFFRYKLLLERGGWWVDTDVVCLRPFDLPDERLLATERMAPPDDLIVSTSVIKSFVGDPLMAWAWDACRSFDTSRITFGQIGPRLLNAGVARLGLHGSMRPHTFFSPIPFFEWGKLIDPSQEIVLGPEAYGVHLWNQMWSSRGIDKSSTFPEGCFYRRLLDRYLSASTPQK